MYILKRSVSILPLNPRKSAKSSISARADRGIVKLKQQEAGMAAADVCRRLKAGLLCLELEIRLHI